jgi:hypothetical protein
MPCDTWHISVKIRIKAGVWIVESYNDWLRVLPLGPGVQFLAISSRKEVAYFPDRKLVLSLTNGLVTVCNVKTVCKWTLLQLLVCPP